MHLIIQKLSLPKNLIKAICNGLGGRKQGQGHDGRLHSRPAAELQGGGEP